MQLNKLKLRGAKLEQLKYSLDLILSSIVGK